MTYNASAVSDTAIAFQKPITLQQGRALRDNPLAVFEADPSAPLDLLPTVHLGTFSPSGSTQTITGLDLTPFKSLRIVWVSITTSSEVAVTIGQAAITAAALNARRGIVTYDLENGIYSGAVLGTSGAGATPTVFPIAGLSTITTATTSISATAFLGGSARIYGLK